MNLNPFYLILTGQISSPIYMYHLPESVSEGILLLGSASGAKLDADLPDYKKAKFQAIVRSNNFQSGYDLAKQVMSIFKEIKSYSDDVAFIHFIQPLHDPIAFPSSKGNFTEFSVNFETVYVEH